MIAHPSLANYVPQKFGSSLTAANVFIMLTRKINLNVQMHEIQNMRKYKSTNLLDKQ